MQIQGFDSYGGYYQKVQPMQIRQISVDEVRKQDEQGKLQNENLQAASEQRNADNTPDLRSRSADLANISLTFNAGETYDYIGRDVSIDNLDMQDAISDMQKDKVLEQYQYFVGPQDVSGNVAFRSEDGIVIQK